MLGSGLYDHLLQEGYKFRCCCFPYSTKLAEHVIISNIRLDYMTGRLLDVNPLWNCDYLWNIRY